jgi:hypothetical protein
MIETPPNNTNPNYEDDDNNDGQGDEFDLSLFENALHTDSDDLENEREARIHQHQEKFQDLLEEMTQEGYTFEFRTNRELDEPMAFNNRLDDLVVAMAPSSIPENICMAIQQNTVTPEQLDLIFDRLTNTKYLDYKKEEEIKKMVYYLEEVIEVIVVDPQHDFDHDIKAQARLLDTLQAASNEIMTYLENKPYRDSEQLSAQAFLLEEISNFLSSAERRIGKSHPEVVTQLKAAYEPVTAALKQISPDHKESRAHLTTIANRMDQAIAIGYDTDFSAEINRQKLDDLLLLIADL